MVLLILTKMGYNKIGYHRRADAVKKIAREHYAPYHDQCLKIIWKRHIRDQFGMCYQTFLNYLKSSDDEHEPFDPSQLCMFDDDDQPKDPLL